MNSFKHILIFIIIPIILCIICLFSFDSSIHISHHNNCSIDLFIAILSDRKNFNKRNVLRNTWFQTIDKINRNNSLIDSNSGLCRIKLNAKFIIGDKECSIHPLFRLNQYSCHSNQIDFETNKSEILLHQFIERQTVGHKQLFRGFSFVIRHSIIATQVGVHQNFLRDDQNITIVLLNAKNKEILLNQNISTNSLKLNEVFYENIEPLVLHKDFYGLLIIDNQLITVNNRFESVIRLNQNGFLNILRAYYGFTDYESIPYKTELIIGPTLVYKANDLNAIKELMNSRNDIQMQWNNEVSNLKENLSKELETNNDIVLVDLVDIYRNLPEKVLLSLQFAIKSYKLTHFVKTDDDCYLNLINILNHLIETKTKEKVWFGNFRRFWPLDYFGKWAENDYESPFYPTFACGSGYALTADLVQWITSNMNYLHKFQGEDVSMGIWLSAVNPYYNDDKRWICNTTTGTDLNISESFSFPQLDEKQIIKIHNFITHL